MASGLTVAGVLPSSAQQGQIIHQVEFNQKSIHEVEFNKHVTNYFLTSKDLKLLKNSFEIGCVRKIESYFKNELTSMCSAQRKTYQDLLA